MTVHSLGHADEPAGFVVLEDARGKELARAGFPALEAHRELVPRTAVVRLVPAVSAGKGVRLRLVTEGGVAEVTQCNNTLAVP
ncbi:hypothetical protein Y887_14385 [Xanthomonas pisi DSM 18956]|nr:hypothetical protein Y887_14385 [Xanthomonas pisi DSM 18956]